MMLNQNAGELSPTGVETKPEATNPWPDAPNIAPVAGNAKAEQGPELDRLGGRFFVTSATLDQVAIGKFGHPVRLRVIQVVLESSRTPFEFSYGAVKLWSQPREVSSFSLN